MLNNSSTIQHSMNNNQNELIIANTTITQDSEGRYCLNDCHKASGMGDNKAPNRWYRNDQTQELIKELAITGISQTPNSDSGRKQPFFEYNVEPVNVIKGGNNPGIYVTKELVYAYAMWISPSFNLQVIRAYDDLCIDKNNEITVEHKDIKNQNIIPFTFENTEVRAINRDGEAWFVGADVARSLGYNDTDQAIRKHCKVTENLKPVNLTGLGIKSQSPRGLTLIPERDVYRLVMRSKLPSAEQFEEKVVSEILPSIRKTGGYMVSISNETPK